jgi:hypothetical protein
MKRNVRPCSSDEPDTMLRDIDRLVPQMGWEEHTIGGHYLGLGMNSLIPGQLLERSVRRVVVDTLSGTGRSRLGILVGTECCVVGTNSRTRVIEQGVTRWQNIRNGCPESGLESKARIRHQLGGRRLSAKPHGITVNASVCAYCCLVTYLGTLI